MAQLQFHAIEPLPGEEWRDVLGFEGQYKISNKGRVWSLARHSDTASQRIILPRIIKLKLNHAGYYYVILRKGGHAFTKKVHTLVCEAFLEKPAGATEVNHINGIRTDNNLTNLEWCDRRYNIWHSYYVNKRKPSGCKPVMCIETGIIYPSCMAAGRDMGIDNGSIGDVASGVYKQMKGFHFKFVNHL